MNTSRLLAGAVVILAIMMALPSMAQGRTITIEDTDTTMMAFINPRVPLASWAGREVWTGIFLQDYLDLASGRRFLIRYPLDQIPPGQRIVSAKWFIPLNSYPSPAPRLFVWRILSPWGLGVSYQNRTTYPKPTPWAAPGMGAPGIDRSLEPSNIVQLDTGNELMIDVTQDVELWYTGFAANHGWALSIDEGNQYLRLDSPLNGGARRYRLRITYEPE